MKRKSAYYLFIAISILLFSACNKEKKVNFNYAQYKIDSIHLTLDIPERNSLFLRYTKIQDTAYFTTLNDLQKQLVVYNISKQQTYKVQISKISPQYLAYTFINFDSIWLVLPKNRIVLIDSALNIKKDLHIHQNLPVYGGCYKVNSSNSTPLVQKENKLFFHVFPTLSPFFDLDSMASYGNREVVLDLTNDSIHLLKGAFPPNYPAKQYRDIFLNRAVGENGVFIYNSFYRPEMEIIDYDKNTFITKKVETNNFDTPTKLFTEMEQNFTASIKYSTEIPAIYPVRYNPYLTEYYRIIHHGIQYENEDGTLSDIDDANWSVVVMDKNFNTLREIVFKGRIYTHNNLMITPKGVLVRKIFKGKSFDTNKVYEYDVFKF